MQEMLIFLFKAIIVIFGLGLLVFIHELGHFVMAKLFKIKVEVFSLGMGPKLIGFSTKETTYQIAYFPIGGFCKFKGDEPSDNMDNISRDPDSFYGAKPYKRIIVAFFGPLFNYILAIIILTILAMGSYKDLYIPSKIQLIDDISVNQKSSSPAKLSGLLSGDEIIKIDNKDIINFDDIIRFMYLNILKKDFDVEFIRDGQKLQKRVTTEWDPEQLKRKFGVTFYYEAVVKYDIENKMIKYLDLKDKDKLLSIDNDYKDITISKLDSYLKENYSSSKSGVLRFQRGNAIIEKTIEFNKINNELNLKDLGISFYYPEKTYPGKTPLAALNKSFISSYEIIVMSGLSIYSLIFKPKKNVENMIGGIARTSYFLAEFSFEGFKESIYKGLRDFFSFIAMISLALAFTNLLPIPALDGGHILTNIVEIIIRKPISLKVMYIINMAGFVFIISLTMLTIYFDILFFAK